MIGLAIDTSSFLPFILLMEKDQYLEGFFLPEAKNVSKDLLPALEKFLQKTQIHLDDLSYIALCTGPGSYTGIRVGASVGSAISYAKKLPLISFCSLGCYIPEKDGTFASILDAKSGGVYLILGEKKGSIVKYTSEAKAFNDDEAKKLLENCPTIVSSESKRFEEKWEKFFLNKIEKTTPNFSHVAKICYTKFQTGDFSSSSDVDFLYLKEPFFAPLPLEISTF
jgi:tRNA threonylcarbamoyladenosine biosynthesis protein TsaB